MIRKVYCLINNLQRIKSYNFNLLSAALSKMNIANQQKMQPLAQKTLVKKHQFLNYNESKSSTNLYASQKLLLTRRTQEMLPEIKSPFLKNTLNKMFSEKRLLQFQPIIRHSNLQQKSELRIQKSKSLMQSIKIKINSVPQQNQKKTNQVKTQVKQFVGQQFLPMKILKSYSESKNDAYFVESGYFLLKKSLDQIEDIKNKAKQKSNRSSRSNSQESQQKDEPSKFILKKLQQLHKKQTYMNVQLKESRSMSLPKQLRKQVKSPVFVVRHKLSKHMYGQQREQIKELTSAIENFKGLDLSKGISVKRYANFFPKVITIQN